jgi:hypothetical protein
VTVPATEVTFAGGQHLRVEGAVHDVEAAILAAARGSIMEFAWLTEADSGESVGISPDQVLMLRALDPDSDAGEPGGAAPAPDDE